MQLSTQNKLVGFLIIAGLIILLVLGFLYFKPTEQIQRALGGIQFNITDNHSTLLIEPTTFFEPKEINEETLTFLNQNGISEVNLIVTEKPTSKVVSEYVNSEELIPYNGSSIQQVGETLNITLYINPDAVIALNKDDQRLQLDTLQQFYLALNDLERSKTSGGFQTPDQYNQNLNQSYIESSLTAQELIDSGNIPFTITRENG